MMSETEMSSEVFLYLVSLVLSAQLKDEDKRKASETLREQAEELRQHDLARAASNDYEGFSFSTEIQVLVGLALMLETDV